MDERGEDEVEEGGIGRKFRIVGNRRNYVRLAVD